MKEKKGLKPWAANLIAIGLEIIIVVVYFALVWNAGLSVFEGNISEAFDGVVGAIRFLYATMFIISICYLAIRPMRTKTTIVLAIWNFIWLAWGIYSMMNA